MIFIPIVAAMLFRLGGVGRDDGFSPGFPPRTPMAHKAWRWCMGIFIGGISAILMKSFWPLLCIVTYFVATNVFSYGENHPFRRWFGRDISWVIYGSAFGLASAPAIGILSIAQGIVGAASFWGLMKLSNDGIDGWALNHCYVELIFGALGTVCFLWI